MARQVLNNIGINDGIQDVIRKTNDNFRRIVTQQKQDVRATVGEVTGDITGDAVGSVNSALSNALAELDSHSKQVEEEFQQYLTEQRDQAEKDIQQFLDEVNAKMEELLQPIADLIYGAEVVDGAIQLPEGMMIPTGNINVISAADETNAHLIQTHELSQDGEENFDITI